jgi:A/G-specific adenine glycosylase
MTPFARDLLSWYDAHARDLPWRGPSVPAYHTWLSEIMLQQTRVQTALPYFHRFLERFPRVEDLAAAPLDDVLAMWSGLGYYSRARNLHRAAQLVAERGGAFPESIVGLKALPGVGDYVSAAVGSIAFGLVEPAIDGNLERVLARVHAHPGGRKPARALGLALIPPDRPGDFNQALMDLGSGVCTPRNPACIDCPVRRHCDGYATGAPTDFPLKKVRKKAPARAAVSAALWRDGRLLLARRPPDGLFGGLYELPGGLLDDGVDPVAAAPALLADRLGLDATVTARLGAVSHTLTHMRLQVEVVAVTAVGEPETRHYTALLWADPTDTHALDQLGLSTLARKVLKVAAKRQEALF